MKKYEPPELTYTAVGNRDAPPPALWIAGRCAKLLSDHGYFPRGGGAPGMDSAFYKASKHAEVYPPWNKFEGFPLLYSIPVKAFEMAEDIIGPRWEKMSDGHRKLHARNMQQVLGPHLDTPSKFLLCYTRDGCDSEATYTKSTGGTGSAIICADRHGIPVINFFSPDWAEHLTMFSGVDFLDLKEEFREYLLKEFATA